MTYFTQVDIRHLRKLKNNQDSGTLLISCCFLKVLGEDARETIILTILPVSWDELENHIFKDGNLKEDISDTTCVTCSE